MANNYGGDGAPAEILSGILDRRFARVKNAPLYRVATRLQPRYTAGADPTDAELLEKATVVARSAQGGDRAPPEVIGDLFAGRNKLKRISESGASAKFGGRQRCQQGWGDPDFPSSSRAPEFVWRSKH